MSLIKRLGGYILYTLSSCRAAGFSPHNIFYINMDTSSSVYVLLNEFISYHHVDHDEIDKFLGAPLESHGCWCPTISKETHLNAVRGHPAGGKNSWDQKCQEFSQCSTCVHNSVSQTVKSKYLKFYTVKFTVDRKDPSNMMNTKILCNPAKYHKKDRGTWLDEEFNEQTCRCDVAFLKEFIRLFMEGVKPDAEYDGVCPSNIKAVTTHASSLSSSSSSHRSDSKFVVAAVSKETAPLTKPTKSEKVDEDLWDEERELFEHDSTTDYSSDDDDDSYAYTDLKLEKKSDSMANIAYNDDYSNYPSYDYYDYEDDDFLAANYGGGSRPQVPSSPTRKEEEKAADTKPGSNSDRSLDGQFFSDNMQVDLQQEKVVKGPTAKPFIDHSKKVCCQNSDKIWVHYHPDEQPPSTCSKLFYGMVFDGDDYY